MIEFWWPAVAGDCTLISDVPCVWCGGNLKVKNYKADNIYYCMDCADKVEKKLRDNGYSL